MPRRSTTHQRTILDKTLVVDNGGFSIKAGFASSTPSLDDCHIVPNCFARERDKKAWVGSEIEACRDFGEMAFRRPVEKGYVVNWEAEKAIWDSTFLNPNSTLSVSEWDCLCECNIYILMINQCDPHETNLVLTEAPNTTAALQSNCDQIVFEEYEFATYSRQIGQETQDQS